MREAFGQYLKKLRLQRRIGLRKFAKLVGILPSNLCHIESGKHNAPRSEDFLARIAKALSISKDSKEYEKLCDLAAKPGEIPLDVKEYFCEEKLMNELPVLARTIKHKKLTRKDIERLIEDLKKK